MTKNSMPQNSLLIFTAASYDPRLKLGAGAKLVLSTADRQLTLAADKLKALPIVTKDFAETTSVRLELETVLWAFESFKPETKTTKVMLCCDFRSTQGLLEKRERLEKSNYEGVRPGSAVINADLFIDFYKQHDRLHFEILSPEDLVANESIKNILFEVTQRAQTALKDKLKSENKVAETWF